MDDVVKKIIKDLYGLDLPVEKAGGGVMNDVYYTVVEGKKLVIKTLNIDELYSELFLLKQACLNGISVPHVDQSGEIDDHKGYYVMDFIEGHKDVESNLDNYLAEFARSVLKLQQVRLSGFGPFIGKDLDNPKFEFRTLYQWMEGEKQRLKIMFGKYDITDLVELVDYVFENSLKIISDTQHSVLVHGDIGIRNTFYNGNEVYLFDSGKNRAMPALWEVASFDCRYFGQHDQYIGDKFKEYYFGGKTIEEEERLITVYRAMVILEKHYGRLKTGAYLEDSFQSRVSSNIQAFRELFK
jgi:tRNA A-37 threonylcarbamoyl transferase component Bud32